MSVSPARALAVVDAGLKAASTDSGPPILDASWSLPPPHATLSGAAGQQQQQAPAALAAAPEYKCAGDEHGLLLFPAGGSIPALGPADGYLPPIGTLLRLQPGHCDPTANLYDWLVGARGGAVEAVWRVAARGPGV